MPCSFVSNSRKSFFSYCLDLNFKTAFKCSVLENVGNWILAFLSSETVKQWQQLNHLGTYCLLWESSSLLSSISSHITSWDYNFSCPWGRRGLVQFNCFCLVFCLVLHTVGYCKDCESGPVFKSKVEDLGAAVLTSGLVADLILSRSLISYLNKEAVLELS